MRFAKWAIPLGAVLGMAAVAVVIIVDPFRTILPGLTVGPITVSGTQVTMERPKLSGFRNDLRPYEVTASAATQDVRQPSLVALKDLRANLATDDQGGMARLEARTGILDTQKEQMKLEQDVHVRTDAGQAVDLRSAFVDFKAGTVVSTEPVSVSLGSGVIEAERHAGERQRQDHTVQGAGPGRLPHVAVRPRREPGRGTRRSRPRLLRRSAPGPSPPTCQSASMISIKQAALAAGALLLTLPVLEAPASAQAEKERAAGFGNFGSSKEPIKIDADRLDVFDKENRAVFAGNVVAVQGDSTMSCTLMTVFYEAARPRCRAPASGRRRPEPAAAPSDNGDQARSTATGRSPSCRRPRSPPATTPIFDRDANKIC